MRPTGGDCAGFSIPELLVSIVLFAVVAAALSSFQVTVFQGQSNTMSRAIVEDDAIMIGRALFLAFETATAVDAPAPGNAGPVLSLRDASQYSHFCVDAAGRMFLYQGTPPVPSIVCGTPVAGATQTPVAGGSSGLISVSALFIRSSGRNNVVRADYSVTLAAGENHRQLVSEHTTRMTVRGPLR